MAFIVPDEFMIPVGAAATKRFQSCTDSWNDSQLGLLRAELPEKYHSVPLDSLKIRWTNIRKDPKIPGYNVGGHGPSVGWSKRQSVVPEWYAEHIASYEWSPMKATFLFHWGNRCTLCNSKADKVFHRGYNRLGCESPTDCIVLCDKHFNLCCGLIPEVKPEQQKELF